METHQTIKSLQVSLDSGQEKDDLWKASKQAKALRAESYFPHVDFATAEFIRPM
jgi:hypothetical protein